MSKSRYIWMSITVCVFLTIVMTATYAFFAMSGFSLFNMSNVTADFERNNMVFETVGGEMSLNVTPSSLKMSNANTIAAENTSTLTVNFQSNSPYSIVCSYDIVYEWTSANKYIAHSEGMTSGREMTVKAVLAENAHVYLGKNKINYNRDLSDLEWNNNSAVVVEGAQIDSVGTSLSTATWTLTSRFYNANVDQEQFVGKEYQGAFKVSNVRCVTGTVQKFGQYDTYWAGGSSNTKDFPATVGTVYTSGPSTDDVVYIAQDNTKYYVCAYFGDYGKELCFSQPYTQYGLEGHTLETDFNSAQRTSGKNALYQVFVDAGFSIEASSCAGLSEYIRCNFGSIMCYITPDGFVRCRNPELNRTCYIDSDSKARCYYS